MSADLKLPLNSIPYQNVDSMVLDNAGESLIDGYIDEFGNTNKRPGFASFIRLGTNKTIDSLYWWEAQNVWIAVSDGRIFKIINATGDIVEITGDKLQESGRVTFATNGNILVMANGGQMVQTGVDGPTAYITDLNAPTVVTHVAYIDFYLLAFQVGGSAVKFADFETDASNWNAIDFFVAESNPDGLTGIYVNRRIIYLFGTQTVELWTNDGFSPFARMNGATANRGTLSPHGIIEVNDSFYFFDSRRRLTVLSGSTPQIIGTAFDRTLQNFDTFNDVLINYTTVIGKNWLIFSFPTENRTLFFDLDGPGTPYWAEWSCYDSSSNSRGRYLGNTISYSPSFNLHIVGDYRTDKIYVMNGDQVSDDGSPIHFSKTTGWIDHDVPVRLKKSYKIKTRMKSGVGLGDGKDSPATARIRWREDGDTRFGNYVPIDLSNKGNREFFKEIDSNGSYYSRQYEITMSDKAPFILGKSFERVDVNEF